MRVLQLIDSLRSGGAERMSVTYANALAKRIDASYLCCTRMEGLLKADLSPRVGYLFLNKKSTLDLKAFGELRKLVKRNKIDLIQAHSSSWFLALLVKLSLSGVKLVWHDHYGRELKERKTGALQLASRYFDGIISVNADLKSWAEEKLNIKHVTFFRNFLSESNSISIPAKYPLLGGRGDDFKVLCLANLRPQKDHLNLLQAFDTVQKVHSQVSLHLLGKDKGDNYSNELKDFVRRNGLESKVFFYGEQPNVQELLLQADLGVLSSVSEGLPLALLEYGRAGLPVVCTAVGECPEVIGTTGLLVAPLDSGELSNAILSYLKNTKERKTAAENYRKKIMEQFSEKAVIPGTINFYEKILAK
ncbi:MAG: glycosyltransferase [Salinimicrobium sp.]